MSIQFLKLFSPALLTGSAATIYTMPSLPISSLLRNGRVLLTNIDSVAHAVTLYAVPNGGTASTTNEFLSAMSIGAGQSIPVDVPQLGFGDFLQGFADTGAKVNIQALDGVIQS